MSAPIASKFQDHYEIFGIETNADLSTIERVYSELIQKFRAGNPETADAEKLEAVHIAYEVLSSPELRKSFDKQKGVGEDKSSPKFSGLEFFAGLERGTGLRSAVLCVLYDRRRNRPATPSLSMRHLESILAATGDQMIFVLWYLKQKSFVASDDKSSLQITVEGMEYLENLRPSSESVLPFIKPTALLNAIPVETPLEVPDAAHAAESDTRRRAVNRILARETN